MALLTSRTGYALAVVYLAIACFAVRTDLIHTVGSWIKPTRDLVTAALVYLLGFGIASGVRRLLQLMGVA